MPWDCCVCFWIIDIMIYATSTITGLRDGLHTLFIVTPTAVVSGTLRFVAFSKERLFPHPCEGIFDLFLMALSAPISR